MRDTLLTGPADPLVEARQIAEREVIERARRVVLELWLDGYRAGNYGFEEMCRRAGVAVSNLGEGHRQRILGQLVDAALALRDDQIAARHRGESDHVRLTVLKLIDRIADFEGLPATESKDGRPTLFDRAAEILRSVGLDASPRQVKRWYYGEP